MATIANLNIMLSATTSKLKGDLDKSLGLFNTFKSQVVGAFAGLSLFGAGHAFLNVAEDIDKLAKLGDRLGVTTQEIMQLQHVADLSGVENLEGALTIMAAKLGEAATEGSAAHKMFADLGMDGRALAKSGMMEALEQIATKFDELSAAQKIHALREVFGKSGAELAAMFKGGGARLRELMGEISGVSREAAASVENLNDSITRLKNQIEDVKRGRTGEFATGLDIFQTMRAKHGTIPAWAMSISQMFMGGITPVEEATAKVLEMQKRSVAEQKALTDEMGKSTRASGWWEDMEHQFDAWLKKIKEVEREIVVLENKMGGARPPELFPGERNLEQLKLMEQGRAEWEAEVKRKQEAIEHRAMGMLGGEPKTTGAASAGSAEAMSIIARSQVRAQVGGGKGSEAQQITRAIDAAKKVEERQERLLEKIREILSKDKALVLPAG